MAYTSHGHHIPGSGDLGGPRASGLVPRCGGPSLCKQCGVEAARFDAMMITAPERSPYDHPLPGEVDLRQPNFD